MSKQWRIYVGAEVPPVGPTPSPCEGESQQQQLLLDTAFARRAALTLQQTPLELRRHPSAAPSPVLRWLLEKEEESKKAGGVSASVTMAPSVDASTPAVNTAAHSAEAKVPSSAVPAAASVLARRGVGHKDPLLQRLMKKQQQQARDAAAAASSSASVSSANGEAKAGGAVAASHWTRHPFSAMSASSWRVFRQQLGITVELVAPPPHAMQASSGTATTAVLADTSRAESSASVRTTNNTTAAATTATMLPADTLAAIRCWEEAQLPYALGRCVARTYALPTAVQAQCVPLALLPSPSSQSETAREASTPSTQSSAMPRNLLTGASSSSSFSSLGVDVLAVAETGSGKTAAYLVPLLHHVLCRAPKLLGHPDRISLGPLSLVVVPTRELAEQVTASLLQLCGQQQQQQQPSSSASKSTGGGVTAGAASRALQLSDIIAWEAEESAAATSPAAAERNWLSEFRVVKVVGGESSEAQYDALASGAHCVVGTVGQLHTLLEDRLLSLGNTHFVVMDEADRMLDEQQEARLVGVLERCPARRQTLMFTATLSAACARVAKRYLATCGYYVVRTPYRCASIRQSFELLSSASAAEMEKRETDGQPRPPPRQQRRMERDGVLADKDGGAAAQQQQQQRRLSPLIHPQKFSRLVAWLVYGTGPIIVFANEKVTCDALFEELRCEAEHLDAQQEYFTIADLVGPPPDGLVFREGTATSSAGHHTSVPSSPVRPNATPSLRNLTSVAVVHSELSQSERRALVAQFQRRQRQVLITTDLLARGLDVAGVTLVVNYDVPWSAVSPADALTLYIHRIGRTGRAGSTGVAVTFISLPAAMVQRAEEVVKEGGDGVASAKNTRPEKKSGADVKANDDDDPMSAMGELFDGDTNNIWAAGVAAAAEEKEEEMGGVVGASRRRLRRRGELDSSEDEGDTADGNGTRQGNNSGSDDDDGASTAGKGGRQAHGGRSGRKAKGGGIFASDVEVLRPLWTFLTECAEGEGCRDGAAALRRGSYAKISVPPALACIMAQLSATSQYGHITL